MRPLVLTLGVLLSVASVSAQTDRPNIVVFLVDDMGWQDTSVAFHSERTEFNDRYHTPHMERLARDGVLFTNAYACSVCSPTRTSVMTGQNAARHRVTNWTLRTGRDQSGRTKRLQSPDGWNLRGLQPSSSLLPQRLHDSGYFTIHAGKAHWGAFGTPGADPTNLGFDVNIAGHCAGGPGDYDGRKNFSARWRNGDAIWDVPGLEHFHGLPVHLTDATTIEALKAVDRAIDADEPFYLYLAHYAIHAPIQPHERYVQRYRDEGLDETEARYASMIEGMDASLGAVLAHLERREVAEHTIVMFLSDNGGLSAVARGESPYGKGPDKHNLPLRAGKASAYEGGTRVPWIVSWARPSEAPLQERIVVRGGTRRATPVHVDDVYPTVLAWAGLGPAADQVVDGHDLSTLLKDAGAGARSERELLFHYPHKWGPDRPEGGYEPHSALRFGGYKVIWFYDDRRWELYDLLQDLGEQDDLSAKDPERLASMAKRLVDALAEVDAQYPKNRKSGEAETPRLPD